MAEYRWNVQENAQGYDAGAPLVHPYYAAVQAAVLNELPIPRDRPLLAVDIGGGSGRFLERLLEAFPQARGVLVDQSAPFIELARGRLERFAGRVAFVQSRLQEDWPAAIGEAPDAIVSMSAIHHLEPAEKQALYQRCHNALSPGGVFVNGDEIRDPDDDVYRASLEKWAAHMEQLRAGQLVSPAMGAALAAWRKRNVEQFDQPRVSGDDCHETLATQLAYLRAAGFQNVHCPWQQEMWGVMAGEKRDG